MRGLRFSRPKGPGFGISRSFYQSVLSSHAVMPPITSIVAPKGEAGAIEGFGAPLAATATKESLDQPMTRGAYAVATRDRKTVLRMLVLSKEEAGFDSEAYARSALATQAEPEKIARIRATWTVAQFTFESHDPEVYPALDFLQLVTQRLALLTEGVVADPLSRRYRLPEEIMRLDRADPKIDARDHVAIGGRTKPDGEYVHTLGMQKFAMPEFEMAGLLPDERDLAARFLLTACQAALLGDPAENGDRYGAARLPFEAREGGFDRAMWEGVPVLELLPPTQATTGEALRAWAEEARVMLAPDESFR